jgi:hypothetical protein
LQAVFQLYQQKHGKTIEQVIKSEFGGDLEKALLSLGKLT